MEYKLTSGPIHYLVQAPGNPQDKPKRTVRIRPKMSVVNGQQQRVFPGEPPPVVPQPTPIPLDPEEARTRIRIVPKTRPTPAP